MFLLKLLVFIEYFGGGGGGEDKINEGSTENLVTWNIFKFFFYVRRQVTTDHQWDFPLRMTRGMMRAISSFITS